MGAGCAVRRQPADLRLWHPPRDRGRLARFCGVLPVGIDRVVGDDRVISAAVGCPVGARGCGFWLPIGSASSCRPLRFSAVRFGPVRFGPVRFSAVGFGAVGFALSVSAPSGLAPSFGPSGSAPASEVSRPASAALSDFLPRGRFGFFSFLGLGGLLGLRRLGAAGGFSATKDR